MKQERIFKYVVPQIVIANGSTAAKSSSAFRLNGIIQEAVVTINDNTGNQTATAAIVDENSRTVWSHASIAENATTALRYEVQNSTTIPLRILVTGPITVVVTPSGDPGASTMTADITLYGER